MCCRPWASSSSGNRNSETGPLPLGTAPASSVYTFLRGYCRHFVSGSSGTGAGAAPGVVPASTGGLVCRSLTSRVPSPPHVSVLRQPQRTFPCGKRRCVGTGSALAGFVLAHMAPHPLTHPHAHLETVPLLTPMGNYFLVLMVLDCCWFPDGYRRSQVCRKRLCLPLVYAQHVTGKGNPHVSEQTQKSLHPPPPPRHSPNCTCACDETSGAPEVEVGVGQTTITFTPPVHLHDVDATLHF